MIGLMLPDGMLMLPQSAPIAHRPLGTTQELGGHFHTISHSACLRSDSCRVTSDSAKYIT